jgi:hypothetical protein
LVLATAWRLVGDGQTVLIYCPQRRSVEPFATVIVNLNERGALPSLFTADTAALRNALTLGEEWLGASSDVLKCLHLGVALHHGALPTSYRKEVERLLREGILKVTISSPTLAQGLNLSATAIVMHSLHRNGEIIKVSEFKNVIGRAGRAYVDVEGLVLFPIFADTRNRRHDEWVKLIEDLGARDMESGLIQLLQALLVRMHGRIGGDLDHLVDYVVNTATAWTFPEISGEDAKDAERARKTWERDLATLDTAILSLIGETDVPDDGIEGALDMILHSSLWQRRLLRHDVGDQRLYRTTLLTRTQYIWSRSTSAGRRGYFLAGLGLEAGHALDAIAPEVNDLLIKANAALLSADGEAAIQSITTLAERVFAFYPFSPEPFPENWRAILRCWLLGQPLASTVAGQEGEALQFIEGGLVYRLPWAMEAIRVRASANGDTVGDIQLDDFELGLAVPAVETGTMSRPASILIQAGFSSRLAAIKVVADTGATFMDGQELRLWVRSEEVAAWSARPDWPTPESKAMWLEFLRDFAPREHLTWQERRYVENVEWYGTPPPPGTPVTLHHWNGQPLVVSADGLSIGRLSHPLNPGRRGLVRVTTNQEISKIAISYLGPPEISAILRGMLFPLKLFLIASAPTIGGMAFLWSARAITDARRRSLLRALLVLLWAFGSVSLVSLLS